MTITKGIYFSIIATILLSIRPIIVKLCYAENIAVNDLLYYRFLIAAPLILSFSLIAKGINANLEIFKNKKIVTSLFFAGFFGYYLATMADFYSLSLIDANINRIILYSFPLYVILINFIKNRQKPSYKFMIIFIIIEICLFVIFSDAKNYNKTINQLGIILAFISAISYACYIIINQETGKKISSIIFTNFAILFSFLLLNIHFFAISPPNNIFIYSHKGIILLIILAIFCTFLPLLLITEAIKLIGANEASLINLSGPILTLIFSSLMLKESLSSIQLIACLIVITAIGSLKFNLKLRKR
jgi:drug/metabolite transporter (DMT)-like permease